MINIISLKMVYCPEVGCCRENVKCVYQYGAKLHTYPKCTNKNYNGKTVCIAGKESNQ